MAVSLKGVSRGEILSKIDLQVADGEILHIVGPSGSGKTSLIRLLNRLDEPSEGEIEILGRPIGDWPPRELRRRVGMVFQEPSLLGLTVRRNLELPHSLAGTPAPEDRIRTSMELAGVEAGLLDREAQEISVGQKQRVTIARCLMTKPEILLLDEATSGLDPRTAERLCDSLRDLNSREGTTLVMVTHRITEAERLGGRMALLIEGRVKAVGEVAEVLSSPAAEVLRGSDE